MSKLEDMVTSLCPQGIEHKPLGEVGSFVRGSGLQKKDLVSSGVGCIHYGQIFTTYGTSTETTKSFVAPELAARMRKALPGDLVIATTSENDEDVCKAVAWLGDSEIAISGDAHVFHHSLDPSYAAYVFQTDAFQRQKRRFITGTKVKRVSADGLARIEVPVPPREIQCEVAGGIRRMESLQAELETELGAELKARSLQYEYYRDFLLSFAGNSSVRWSTLGEIGVFTRGRRFTKADVVETGIPSIHYGEIYTRYGVYADRALSNVRADLSPALRFAKTGDVVVAAVGETVEDVGKAVAWLGLEDVAIHDDCFAYRHDMDPKFVSYCFQTAMFHAQKARYVARAKVKRIAADGLGRIRIPVPPLAEQRRIVAILDTYDALIKDLSNDLPAEMRVRREQYQHYRDSLLTFDRAVA